jgi:hypothetical protein
MLERALKHAPVVRRMQMMHDVLTSFEAAAESKDASVSSPNVVCVVRGVVHVCCPRRGLTAQFAVAWRRVRGAVASVDENSS